VFEVQPTWGASAVTAFARMGGRAVGFVANQPMRLGGMLTAPACEKIAHFVAVCDAFGLPLIYLIDVPGFSIGTSAEKSMLGRRSARMVYEIGHATVPRISVVLRKGYGMGYVAMCGGRGFDVDAALAWPTAEICPMSIEGSVDVVYRKDYEQAPDPAARRQELIDDMRAMIDPLRAAGGFGIDDLIEPADTRRRLNDILSRAGTRRAVPMPPKVRSISPI
jgi:acetyl-CoA carboxylase carboxyltransferase component